MNQYNKASKIVGYLIENDLDERYAEIFEIAADLELPIGIGRLNQSNYSSEFDKLSVCIKQIKNNHIKSDLIDILNEA